MRAKFVNEKLKFSDGVEFDAEGELHLEVRHDGWYVVGQGMLIPVNSEEESNKIITKMKLKKDGI